MNDLDMELTIDLDDWNPNDPEMRSWLESANDPTCDFPIQNLPFCVFTRDGGPSDVMHVGIGIGDFVLDLVEIWPELDDENPHFAAEFFDESSLNHFLSAGREAWTYARRLVSYWLHEETPDLRDDADLCTRALIPISEATMHLPVEIGDYTDFYASEFHATNVGKMFRPDGNALLPNWKHIPVGYHGRASSIVVSGTEIVRPKGQTVVGDSTEPKYGPSRLIDYELEIGFVTGPGNEMGEPITIDNARDHIFGLVLLNDWSARDIQKWEYVPLGPFLAKNFASTISAWVVTLDALEPYRVTTQRQESDPKVQPYLDGAWDWGMDVNLDVYIYTDTMEEQDLDPFILTQSNFKYMYWNVCHQLTHQTCSGCNVRPGDLYGSGTISGPEKHERGCMLELTWRGSEPVTLPSGEERKFLADGDTIIMTGYAGGGDTGLPRIGFGDCMGTLLPAVTEAAE